MVAYCAVGVNVEERSEEDDMGGALRRAILAGGLRWAVLAVVLMLAQGCASDGAMQSGQSASGTPGASRSPGAQTYGIYGEDSYFKLEWGPDERRGKPMVSGYVTNTWGMGTRNVRLRVEALDAAGAVTATYTAYVSGDVPPGAHIYWEVSVREKAPSYRVTVLSFDPVSGHG